MGQRSEPQHSWPCSCSEDCFPSAPRARPCYLQWTPASVSLQHLNFKIVKWQFLPPALPPRVPCLTLHPLIRTLRPLSLPFSFVPCIQSAQFHQIHGSLPYPKPMILFWVLTILEPCSILICRHQSVLMFFFSWTIDFCLETAHKKKKSCQERSDNKWISNEVKTGGDKSLKDHGGEVAPVSLENGWWLAFLGRSAEGKHWNCWIRPFLWIPQAAGTTQWFCYKNVCFYSQFRTNYQ